MNITQKIYQEYQNHGGCSYSLSMGEFMLGSEYYSVAALDNKESIFSIEDFNVNHIETYISNNIELLKQDDRVLGVWKKDDKVYLDISILVPKENKQKALESGLNHHQRAIYDLENGEELIIE